MNIEFLDIKAIKPNPKNPRLIKDDAFKKLVLSLQDFPEMLELRPVIVNADNVILGGNMRYRAAKEVGLKQVPVIKASTLDEARQAEFIIKDNVPAGEWDGEILANEWDASLLNEWGLNVPDFSNLPDYSENNKELDLSLFEDKMELKLVFTKQDFETVNNKLNDLMAETGTESKEAALLCFLDV
jgi:hypothetical protein